MLGISEELQMEICGSRRTRWWWTACALHEHPSSCVARHPQISGKATFLAFFLFSGSTLCVAFTSYCLPIVLLKPAIHLEAKGSHWLILFTHTHKQKPPEYLKLSTETCESALDKFLTSESCFQEGRDSYCMCSLDFSRSSSNCVRLLNTFEIFRIAQD